MTLALNEALLINGLEEEENAKRAVTEDVVAMPKVDVGISSPFSTVLISIALLVL
ncbi:hypothetical protein PTT_07402 [Pyrenophora teres f. teres 0-1]|uniref:Uncharacterized protein n=1 Tax=Pyrenophora teres f. teres (strain 0-1) TaxID=861557 RepID=E3RHJ7_PYRTT|nr:hypothetical protein PTT_07402 [Pyrenophora teres f. teres 0-1]